MWLPIFQSFSSSHSDGEESGRGREERTSHLKVTENAFDISQDLLPVGPVCLQHLLHCLHVKIRRPADTASFKQLSKYCCESQTCTV